MALPVPGSMMSALYPRPHWRSRFRDSAGETRRPGDASRHCGKYSARTGLIVSAEPLVRVIYGERYVDAVPTLRLLAALLPLHGANAALGQAMQAAHLQNALLGMTVLAVVSNLLANLCFVGRWGIEGAAIALGLSSALSLVVQAVIHHRRIEPLRLEPRHLLMIALVVAPIVATLSSDSAHRMLVALGGVLAVALFARPVGLLAANDLRLTVVEARTTGTGS